MASGSWLSKELVLVLQVTSTYNFLAFCLELDNMLTVAKCHKTRNTNQRLPMNMFAYFLGICFWGIRISLDFVAGEPLQQGTTSKSPFNIIASIYKTHLFGELQDRSSLKTMVAYSTQRYKWDVQQDVLVLFWICPPLSGYNGGHFCNRAWWYVGYN